MSKIVITKHGYEQTQFELEKENIVENEKEELALVNIVLLMAKANRTIISSKEFHKIIMEFFKMAPEEVIPELEKQTFLKKEGNNFVLLKEKSFFEERIKEIKHDAEAKIERIKGFWLKEGIPAFMYGYCLYEGRKEVQTNKFEYMGKVFEGKEIVGIGGQAIALQNKGEIEFCNFYRGNGHEVALKIIKKYGDLTNPHLKYITKDVED